MVRQMGPWLVRQHYRFVADGITNVNAIQTQQRFASRKGAGWLAVGLHKHLMQARALSQLIFGAVPPVIEVARYYQRCLGRNLAGD